MKIWLDDLRPAPWGYESARSVNEAKTLIREAERNGIEIEVVSRFVEQQQIRTLPDN